MPALVAVAALFVIGLLIPTMFSQNEVSMKDQSSENKMMKNESADTSTSGADMEKESITDEKSDMAQWKNPLS